MDNIDYKELIVDYLEDAQGFLNELEAKFIECAMNGANAVRSAISSIKPEELEEPDLEYAVEAINEFLREHAGKSAERPRARPVTSVGL